MPKLVRCQQMTSKIVADNTRATFYRHTRFLIHSPRQPHQQRCESVNAVTVNNDSQQRRGRAQLKLQIELCQLNFLLTQVCEDPVRPLALYWPNIAVHNIVDAGLAANQQLSSTEVRVVLHRRL